MPLFARFWGEFRRPVGVILVNSGIFFFCFYVSQFYDSFAKLNRVKSLIMKVIEITFVYRLQRLKSKSTTTMTIKLFKAAIPFLGAAMLVHAGEWVGEISTSDVRVSVGETPNIEWRVTYPVAGVEDVIEIVDDEITPKRCLTMAVRLLGASWSTPSNYYYVDGALYLNGVKNDLFYGYHQQINPTEVVFEELVEPGDTIGAAARGSLSLHDSRHSVNGGGSWSPLYTTWSDSPNVVLLKNGDVAPQLSTSYAIQKNVRDHLAPYMDGSTGKMVLGPRDVVYLFDFNDHTSSGFDLQDFCVLLTFTDADCDEVVVTEPDSSTNGNGHGNNGHGNNADGVDVSNPGQGGGGPNGEPDTDYDGDGTYEDDEAGNGKGKDKKDKGW